MKNLWNTCTFVALLMASLCPAIAEARSETPEPIPTVLMAMDQPVGYPDPICSKCKIIVIEDEGTAGTQASVRIEYPVNAPQFVGEVELTVWLMSGERQTAWLSGVSLEPGDEVELVAEAATGWSWEEVRFVWVRFVVA